MSELGYALPQDIAEDVVYGLSPEPAPKKMPRRLRAWGRSRSPRSVRSEASVHMEQDNRSSDDEISDRPAERNHSTKAKQAGDVSIPSSDSEAANDVIELTTANITEGVPQPPPPPCPRHNDSDEDAEKPEPIPVE